MGLHLPPKGKMLQSALVQQVVEHFFAPVGMVGSMGVQAPLAQSEATLQVAPKAAVPLPAIPVWGGLQTFATKKFAASTSYTVQTSVPGQSPSEQHSFAQLEV